MSKLFNEKIHKYLNDIYKPLLNKDEIQELSNKVYDLFPNISENQDTSDWSKEDVFLITYGDSLIQKNQKKLQTLNEFLNTYCCLLYTSDATDDSLRVDLGGRRIIKKKKKNFFQQKTTTKAFFQAEDGIRDS